MGARLPAGKEKAGPVRRGAEVQGDEKGCFRRKHEDREATADLRAGAAGLPEAGQGVAEWVTAPVTAAPSGQAKLISG